MVTYKTKAGDVLDRVCYLHYTSVPDAFEQVLAANPGLAAKGPVFCASITINLPHLDPAPLLNTLDLFS